MAAKKKTAKKKSAAKSTGKSKEYELVVSMLQRNPKVDFATVRAAAEKKGMKLYPIVYGRAQAALGIVKSAKRGQGKAKRAAAAAATRSSAKRGPGRPRKTASLHDGLDAVISQIRETERERDRALQALAKIRDLIDSVL